MENKEIEKEIVKILDKITDYKVPCDCPKGGIIEMMDGNHSYTCPKCDGSEWVVNPKLVKELLALHPQQPLERIPEETKESNSTPLKPLQNGEREEAEDLYTKGHKKWKATIQPATKDIGNMKPYTN